jgi:hypothetical protein
MAIPLIILLGDYSYRDRLYIVPVHWMIDFFPPPSREWIESEIQFNVKDLEHVILCTGFYDGGGSVKDPIKIVCEGEADRTKVE